MSSFGVKTCGDYLYSGHTCTLVLATHFINECQSINRSLSKCPYSFSIKFLSYFRFAAQLSFSSCFYLDFSDYWYVSHLGWSSTLLHRYSHCLGSYISSIHLLSHVRESRKQKCLVLFISTDIQILCLVWQIIEHFYNAIKHESEFGFHSSPILKKMLKQLYRMNMIFRNFFPKFVASSTVGSIQYDASAIG